MSNDSVTVRTSQSWFSRIGGAIAGVLIGLFLFGAAFPLLGWNEGRAIKRSKTLEAGSREVISIPVSPVEAANEGRLVHVTGAATVEGELRDPVFGVAASAIQLRRNVEMYQWTQKEKSETQKKLGGGEETVTTYTYQKEWSSDLIDSSAFHKPEGHENPDDMPVERKTFLADNVSVGAFTLPETMIEKIADFRSLPVTKGAELPTDLSAPVAIFGEGFYVGRDPKAPAVGDLKVDFEFVKPGEVSIVAGQVGHTFEPYRIGEIGDIEILQTGIASANSMFASERQSNTIITWLLRFVGFMMMYAGLSLIAKPMAVVADFIPFLGRLADAGIGFVALLVALALTIGTVALAWLAYRPLLGVPSLLVAIASVVLAVRTLRRKKALKAATA